MQSTKLILAAALAGAVAIPAAFAQSGPAPKPDFKFEKCFGVVKAGSNEAVSAQTLEAKVRGIVSQNPDVAVFVAGDAKANYQKVMDALVLLQGANVKKVGLMSQPDQAAQKAVQGRR